MVLPGVFNSTRQFPSYVPMRVSVRRPNLKIAPPETNILPAAAAWKITFKVVRLNIRMGDSQCFCVVGINCLVKALPIGRSDRDLTFYRNFQVVSFSIAEFQNPGLGGVFGRALFEKLQCQLAALDY